MPHPRRAYNNNNIEDYITVLDDCMMAGTNNCTTYRVKLGQGDELKDTQASSKLIQCQYYSLECTYQIIRQSHR